MASRNLTYISEWIADAERRIHDGNERRRKRAAENRAKVMAGRRCKWCSELIPERNWDSTARVYCDDVCHGHARRQRESEKRGGRPERKPHTSGCAACEGLSHRRPKDRPCKCGGAWGPDLVRAEDHMWRASNLARVMGRATLYGVAHGSGRR